MASPLLPLTHMAGSLALSFTGVAQAPATATPAAAVAPAVAPAVVPTPPAAAPPTLPPESTPAADPVAPPVAATTTAPPMIPRTNSELRRELAEAGATSTRTERPSLLRPTDKRFFFTMFVGGAKSFLGGYGNPYGGGMDFKIEGAVGGHGLKNRSLAGAAVIQVTSGFPFSSFTLAPRLQWDKLILPDYAIYMTTTLTAGYRVSTYSGYGILLGLTEGALHGGVIAVGWGASTIVAERLLLSFRPVNVELSGPGAGFPVQINYDVIGGLGVVW
jgi:hypothetical protein